MQRPRRPQRPIDYALIGVLALALVAQAALLGWTLLG